MNQRNPKITNFAGGGGIIQIIPNLKKQQYSSTGMAK